MSAKPLPFSDLLRNAEREQAELDKKAKLCVNCEKAPPWDGTKLCEQCLIAATAQDAAERKEKNEERIARHIPPRYKPARLSDFDNRPKIPRIEKLEGIVLRGPNGTGKTHMAAALLFHYSARSMAWYCVPELLSEIRGTFGKKTRSEDEIVMRVSEADLLVLDDLGAEKTTEWSLSTLYAIINRRLDYLLPTIITTNLTFPQLEELEPRIASRLASFSLILLDGDDRRLSKS